MPQEGSARAAGRAGQSAAGSPSVSASWDDEGIPNIAYVVVFGNCGVAKGLNGQERNGIRDKEILVGPLTTAVYRRCWRERVFTLAGWNTLLHRAIYPLARIWNPGGVVAVDTPTVLSTALLVKFLIFARE